MQGIWTEELPPVVVPDGAGAHRLTARIWVTGVGAAPSHVEVVLAGELCVSSTPHVAAALENVLSLDAVDVRFDLTGLRLCTSAGIDLFVEVAARLQHAGGDLRLDGAAGVVRRALDAGGVSDSGTVRRPGGA